LGIAGCKQTRNHLDNHLEWVVWAEGKVMELALVLLWEVELELGLVA